MKQSEGNMLHSMVRWCTLAYRKNCIFTFEKYCFFVARTKKGKKSYGVSPLWKPWMCTHTHMHSFVQEAGVLCGRHGNSDPPDSPPPYLTYPLPSFMTLCNLLIWNRVLVTQSEGCSVEVEGSSKKRRTGGDLGGGGYHGRQGSWYVVFSLPLSFPMSLSRWVVWGTLMCIISLAGLHQ